MHLSKTYSRPCQTNVAAFFGSYHCIKKKFSIKDFFNKCDQIRRFLQIFSHLLKKSLMENFIFRAVYRSVASVSMNLCLYITIYEFAIICEQ